MTNFYTGADKWVYPIWLPAESPTLWSFRYKEDGEVNQDIRLKEGWYYNIKDDEAFITFTGGAGWVTPQVSNVDLLPLLSMLEASLNEVAVANTFEIVSADPINQGPPNSAFKINRTSGTTDWSLSSYLDPAFNQSSKDASLVGQRMATPSPEQWSYSLGENTMGGSYNTAFYVPYGTWCPGIAASDKRSNQTKQSFSAGYGKGQYYVNRWVGQNHRRIRYFNVPSPYVRNAPADIFELLPPTDLITQNYYNKFLDLWTVGAESGRDSILIHNTGTEDGASLNYKDHEYELVRFVDPQSFSDVRSVIRDIPGGERYELDFKVLVTFSNWRH